MSRLFTWLAFAVTLTCVIAVPLGFFYLSYQYIDGSLGNEAKINARIITEIINSNPEMWEYEQIRLTEFLSRQTDRGQAERRSILNAKGEVVTEITADLDQPVVEHSVNLLDSGVVVGKIAIQRSLRPLLTKTLAVAVLSISIGISAFLFIRIIPIRTLERKEDALRQSEKKYRDLFENANDAICIAGPDQTISDANTEAVRMTGYSREEVKKMKLFDLIRPEKLPAAEASPPYIGDSRAKYIGRIKTKGGNILDVEVSSSLITLGMKMLGSRNIVRDLTERRRLEEELRRAHNLESIGVLAGGIAHDFNNILTAILGNISMAKLSLSPDDASYEKLLEAEKASRRAKDLTHQLLTFSKGGAPVKKTSSIVQIIRDSAGFALRGSNVRYELLLNDDICPVDIDEGQISQVMNNLLINADQAMPDGGVVLITAENIVSGGNNPFIQEHRNYVKITIEDRGIGISKDHLQKIFDPYFTTKQKGSGLGLAITFSIIKKHDGYITVKSDLGAGTTFTIYLPASRKAIERDAPEGKAVRGSARRVLLMDDEELVKQVAGAMLQSEGHTVGFAADGDETVELYRTAMESGQPFDLVIIDLTIPGGMGGKETMSKLIEIDPSVKAIVSSGYSTDPVLSDYKKYGFASFLAKPYTIQELNRVLLETLQTGSQSRSQPVKPNYS